MAIVRLKQQMGERTDTIMNPAKRKELEAAGRKFGSAADFLNAEDIRAARRALRKYDRNPSGAITLDEYVRTRRTRQ